MPPKEIGIQNVRQLLKYFMRPDEVKAAYYYSMRSNTEFNHRGHMVLAITIERGAPEKNVYVINEAGFGEWVDYDDLDKQLKRFEHERAKINSKANR